MAPYSLVTRYCPYSLMPSEPAELDLRPTAISPATRRVVSAPDMTDESHRLRDRLDRFRRAAAYAERDAMIAPEAPARRLLVLLSEGWACLADDLEHRLNGKTGVH